MEESFGTFWGVLERPGEFFRAWESFGAFGRVSGVFGRLLERLRKFCGFGRVVVRFGEFWSVSENAFGKVLESLEGYQSVWERGAFCSVWASFGAVH